MRIALAARAIVAAGGVSLARDASQGRMPAKVGAYVTTTIARIDTRFSDTLAKPKGDGMDAGTSIALKNGVSGVSDQFVDAIGRSKVGDPVITCLVSLPKTCPPGGRSG